MKYPSISNDFSLTPSKIHFWHECILMSLFLDVNVTLFYTVFCVNVVINDSVNGAL